MQLFFEQMNTLRLEPSFNGFMTTGNPNFFFIVHLIIVGFRNDIYKTGKIRLFSCRIHIFNFSDLDQIPKCGHESKVDMAISVSFTLISSHFSSEIT